MESHFGEPVSHSPASFTNGNTIHSSDNLLNFWDVEGKKSNKAIDCTNINEFGSDDTNLVDELLDHSCLAEDEIPRVEMQFNHLKLAQDFYATYAKKVGFVSKIRNTNYDRMTKEPINQSIHCNREGFRGSCVKAPTRKNMVAAVECRARVYANFDREKQDWVLLKVELRHSHPCSTRKAVHYHENKELTMHGKCMIERLMMRRAFDPTRYF
ncbi:protein FAR-RED IMPAIRED RESPONSE 1-like [Arachis hypogaea]|uniref:protein FAR-RED IMPAIRED RESPONSE 1-like n=1 Tax=Arachis hypogaea TaxID=3818 RepID=UPI003B20B7B8